jgi:hypothetical protein
MKNVYLNGEKNALSHIQTKKGKRGEREERERVKLTNKIVTFWKIINNS